MEVREFIDRLESDFICGVPDSTLQPLCDFLMNESGIGSKHIIGANEGNCVGIAAGYYLSTGKVPVVYLQNSGIGNIVNPVVSLMNNKIYGIPCIFIIGWRGQPGIKDEPQHLYQGEITEHLVEQIGVKTFTINPDTSSQEMNQMIESCKVYLEKNQQVAFLVPKDVLQIDCKMKYSNGNTIKREEAIRRITAYSGEEVIVASTGKISRELYEIREQQKQSHKYDFLTVGGMGHCSSIAMGIALQKPGTQIWCLDGDGSFLMHMGAGAVVAHSNIHNLVHIVFNNGAHESVGGLPTVANDIDLCEIASACGYEYTCCVNDLDELDNVLSEVKEKRQLSFVEIKVAIGSRSDLGRPNTSPEENKKLFMEYLKTLK